MHFIFIIDTIIDITISPSTAQLHPLAPFPLAITIVLSVAISYAYVFG